MQGWVGDAFPVCRAKIAVFGLKMSVQMENALGVLGLRSLTLAFGAQEIDREPDQLIWTCSFCPSFITELGSLMLQRVGNSVHSINSITIDV